MSGIIKNYAGIEISLNNVSQLFSWEILSQWLPEFIFGFLLLITLRFFRHCLVLPGIMFLTVVSFYLFLGITGISLDEARGMGLLMEKIALLRSFILLVIITHLELIIVLKF